MLVIKFVDNRIYREKNGEIIKAKTEILDGKGNTYKVVIVEGMRVKVVPLNSNKKRNRDRIGVVTGFTEQYEGVRAKVQFEDTKGIGKIVMQEIEIIK
ncbi:hypothetical protein GCM10008929_19980 [Alkalibacterium psychrotolerans]